LGSVYAVVLVVAAISATTAAAWSPVLASLR
jgi:hypothetical protein